MACGILVPQEKIESMHSAFAVWSFNHWTAREVQVLSIIMICFCLQFNFYLIYSGM